MNAEELNQTENTSFTVDTANKSSNKTIKTLIIIIAVVLIGAIVIGGAAFIGIAGIMGGMFLSEDNSSEKSVTEEMYIGVAKEIISKSLKKPSSLEVNDAYIYEKDEYGSAIVYMDITSENSFGGADRDTVYVCVMYLKSDGSYKFNSSFNYTDDLNNLDILKSYNGFGKPEQ